MSRRNANKDEKKDSPSKTTKIVMKYISSLADVGMQRSHQQIEYQTLVEMGKNFDKSEEWISSDLRLIFSLKRTQEMNDVISKLEGLIKSKQESIIAFIN